MGDGTGQARVGRRPMIWEQDENAFITAAQTGADPEAGAQQLRLIRFANPRSGQQVIENAGVPSCARREGKFNTPTGLTLIFVDRTTRGQPPTGGSPFSVSVVFDAGEVSSYSPPSSLDRQCPLKCP